jgi:hypothetical protein
VCYSYASTTEVCRFAGVFGRFHTVAESVGYLYDVSPSAWMNFHKILYWGRLLKSVEKIYT